MPNKNIIKDAVAPRSNHPALRAPLQRRGIANAEHLMKYSFIIITLPQRKTLKVSDTLNSPPTEGWPKAGVVFAEWCVA